jgi:hypothetical protein
MVAGCSPSAAASRASATGAALRWLLGPGAVGGRGAGHGVGSGWVAAPRTRVIVAAVLRGSVAGAMVSAHDHQ